MGTTYKGTTHSCGRDWVVSIMEPIDDLLDMYTQSIQDYERKRNISGDGEVESPDSD